MSTVNDANSSCAVDKSISNGIVIESNTSTSIGCHKSYGSSNEEKYSSVRLPTVQFSEKSRRVVEEANKLLELIESGQRSESRSGLSSKMVNRSESPEDIGQYSNRYGNRPVIPRRHPSLDRYFADGSPELDSVRRYQIHTPRFPRVDFDDILDEELADRKPAWQQLQENIRSSYQKPRRFVERHRELNEMQDATLNYAAARHRQRHRTQSPFSLHLNGESFTPRMSSWIANNAIQPRGLDSGTVLATPYCAPALNQTSALESESQPGRPSDDASTAPFARYERLVDDIEARLLRTSVLPAHLRGVTRREFCRAPQSSAGSATKALQLDEELGISLPRPYYSRPDRRDPNYFDFDLQHSIDMYRKPEGAYVPRGPQLWENRMVREAMYKGDAPVSGYIFTRGQPLHAASTSADVAVVPLTAPPPDWRTTGTSYLSAALRTPAFWEHRFASIGAQVRDSNPVSMDSLLRNKPVPNRFTEYRDPDFEYYEDPREPE